MGIADRVSSDRGLPEQPLLRDGDRLHDLAAAFLRGEITAEQYSVLTLAEIARRAPIEAVPAWAGSVDVPAVAAPQPLQLVHEEPPVAPTVPVPPPVAPQVADRDRSIVLARAFATGRIRGADFLRLIRDC